MNLLEKSFERLKSARRFQSLVVVAVSCCVCVNGFGQLIYLTDSRSVSGSASVTDVSQYNSAPYYTTSYTGDYSGSASPSSTFADFNGNANGTATFQGGISGVEPMTISTAVTSTQDSFLHPQELYFSSSASVSGSPWPIYGSPTSQWWGQANSSLQVTFMVSAPVAFNLIVEGTGDPLAAGGTYNLSSSAQGALVNGNTDTLSYYGEYGVPVKYSGTFDPGNIYTLSLTSGGGLDGGGFLADLTVPEPSMTSLAGLAFLIFLLRAQRIGRRAVRGS